jgi:hypothetical protein
MLTITRLLSLESHFGVQIITSHNLWFVPPNVNKYKFVCGIEVQKAMIPKFKMKNIDLGSVRTGCWGKYLDKREEVAGGWRRLRNVELKAKRVSPGSIITLKWWVSVLSLTATGPNNDCFVSWTVAKQRKRGGHASLLRYKTSSETEKDEEKRWTMYERLG